MTTQVILAIDEVRKIAVLSNLSPKLLILKNVQWFAHSLLYEN